MPDYIGDPPTDTMQDRLEIKIRELLKGSADLNGLKVFYRGEPSIVPIHLHPFAIIFLTEQNEASGQEGYEESTGMRYYRFDGYVALEVVHRDIEGLSPVNRDADVPSYLDAKKYTQASFNAIMTWGGPSGRLIDDPVISFDGKERTVELRADTIVNGLSRRHDNVSNRGSFEFHIYTVRLNY
jgi:hypothetical protein